MDEVGLKMRGDHEPALFHRAPRRPTRLARVVGGGSPRARFGFPHHGRGIIPPMRIVRSIVIDRHVEEVFAFVADPHNDVRWCDKVLDVEQVEGDGPGTG